MRIGFDEPSASGRPTFGWLRWLDALVRRLGTVHESWDLYDDGGFYFCLHLSEALPAAKQSRDPLPQFETEVPAEFDLTYDEAVYVMLHRKRP